MLAYEPADRKRISSTTFNTYLVNDSNYYIHFSYLAKARESDSWKLRYCGVVEPNIELLVEELQREDLPEMDDIAFQAIAYKPDRDFSIKPVIDFSRRIDTTKFAKLHCFHQ